MAFYAYYLLFCHYAVFVKFSFLILPSLLCIIVLVYIFCFGFHAIILQQNLNRNDVNECCSEIGVMLEGAKGQAL